MPNGNPLKRVTTGQPFAPSASLHNATIDTIEAVRRMQETGAGAGGSARPPGIVLVKNDSGADRNRFDVLGISSILISPTQNESEFKDNFAFVCVGAVSPGKLAVLAESIPNGKIGRAYVYGVTVVKVNVTATSHGFADAAGSNSYLDSKVIGSARILWKEDGTGEKWAVVMLSTRPDYVGTHIEVLLTEDGGTDGDKDSPATWTYTAHDLNANELGTGLSPNWPRPNGSMTAAEKGAGYFGSGGTFALAIAYEVPATTDECEEEE